MKVLQLFDTEGLNSPEPILGEIHQIMIDLRVFLRSPDQIADPLRTAEQTMRLERLAFCLSGSVLERLINGYQMRDSLINRVTGKTSKWIQARLQIAFMPPDIINAYSCGYVQIDHVEILAGVENELDRANLIELIKRERISAVRLSQIVANITELKITTQPSTCLAASPLGT